MASIRDVIARLRVDGKKVTPELRRARAKFKRFGTGVKRDLSRSFSKATGVLKTAAGIGGIVGFASIGKDVLDFETKLKRLEIQAGKSKLNLGKFRDSIGQVSDSTGQSRQGLLDAAAKFVSLTGDAETAQNALDLFGRISTGTGSSLEDVAAAAASLTNNLGIKSVTDMERAFAGMAAQGDKGAIEVKELATLLPGLADPFQQFAAKGPEALAKLGANLQVVRQGFGSGAEAATGLQALMTKIQKNARKFKGVEIFTTDAGGTKRLRDFNDIVRDIGNSKLAKNPEKLIRALGSVEAFKAFTQLNKGRDAVQGFVDAASDGSVIMKKFADFSNSDAGKIKKSWERVKNTLARTLTPERIAKFATAMERLAEVVQFVVDHIVVFASAIAAVKIAAFAAQLSQAALMAGGMKTALGLASGAVGVLGAAFAGFAIGSAIDEWLGLSDAISDALVNMDKADARAQRAFLRERAQDLGGGTGVAAALTRAQIGAGGLTDKQRRSALTLAGEAERSGFVGPGGKIARTQARKIATAGLSDFEIAKAGGTDALTDNLIRAVELGLAERNRVRGEGFAAEVAAAAPAEQISIEVTGQFRFDQNGLAVMDKPRAKKDRRGVTR